MKRARSRQTHPSVNIPLSLDNSNVLFESIESLKLMRSEINLFSPLRSSVFSSLGVGRK